MHQDLLKELEKFKVIMYGHFILSSGLHSSAYIQCAKIFSNPELSSKICISLAKKIEESAGNDFDMIVSPAMGGIIAGYEIAKYFNINYSFCERVNGIFQLRRGFKIPDKSKILIVEDIVTTGKSSLEVVKCIKEINNTASISAISCIIDRSSKESSSKINIPLVSLMKLEIETYTEDNLPESLASTEAIRPGSRWNEQPIKTD